MDTEHEQGPFTSEKVETFKIQRPLMTTAKVPTYLIYNKDRSIQVELASRWLGLLFRQYDKELNMKLYVKANITDGTFQIHDVIPTAKWPSW